MNISIDSYPFFKSPKIGPLIFLNRLSKQIRENNKNIKLYSKFNPFYDIGIFSTLDKSFYNKPFILRLDGLFIDQLNTKYNSRHENQKIYNSAKKSAGIIFVSQYCKDIFESLFGKLNKPNKIINNGVSLKQFSNIGTNLRKKLNIGDDKFVIISSASWRRHKRLEETIKFYNLMKKEINNLVLIILGKKTNIYTNDRDIIFAGYVEERDLPYWYRSSNLYLHLAWIEPNANSQAEAIASGLPSLCANNGGNFELVIKSNAGIVSSCDKIVKNGLINYYNPPEPDYEILKNDFMKIYDNYDVFKENINRNNIDIANTAQNYIKFCEDILSKIDEN